MKNRLDGRKIKAAEHLITFVKFLRALAERKISPEEPVKAYHGELQKLGIPPKRDLDTDSEITTVELSFAS